MIISYVWNHEDDSRTWVAPSLKQFIEWWSDGTISIQKFGRNIT
ncbi:Alpha/beta hydrolase [Bacillus sp. IT-79MI2]|nr:hypothetical protein BTH41_01032 [Bacillus mycoides]